MGVGIGNKNNNRYKQKWKRSDEYKEVLPIHYMYIYLQDKWKSKWWDSWEEEQWDKLEQCEQACAIFN